MSLKLWMALFLQWTVLRIVDGARLEYPTVIRDNISFSLSNCIDTNKCDFLDLRGGETNDQDEDTMLDAYVEGLLNGDIGTDETPKRRSKKRIRKKKTERLESTPDLIKNNSVQSLEQTKSSDERKNKESYSDDHDDVSNTRHNQTDSKESIDTSEQNDEPVDVQLQTILPPNQLQRYLLSYGFIGRALAAFSVVVSEFIHNYLPDIDRFVVMILPSSSSASRERLRERRKGGVHSQYAVFTSGSGIGGKKASKNEKKLLDQVALDKLKHVKGGTKTGKYAHLSLAFMKKYNLGEKFANEAKIFETIIAPLERESKDDAVENDEMLSEDEDDDWVIKAFRDDVSSSRMDFDDINIYSLTTPKARKTIKVKAGDRESMMGRLRTTGVAGVSSKLMGAYPGDAYAIEDSASKYGVVELAERYGYGEWSDSDDNDTNRKKQRKKTNDDSLSSFFRTPKRESRRGFKKADNFSVSFEVGLSASTSKRKPNVNFKPTRSRLHSEMTGSSRRKSSSVNLDDEIGRSSRSNRIENVSKRNKSSTLSDLRSSFIRDDSSVRAPMERTRDKKKKDAEEISKP